MEPQNQFPPGQDARISPPESAPVLRAGWLRGVLFFIAYIVWYSIFGIGLALAFGVVSEEQLFRLLNSPTGLLLNAGLLIVTVLLVWAFRRGIDRRSLVSLGLSFDSRHRKDSLYGVLWGLGMVTAVFLVLWLSESVVVTGWQVPWVSLLVMIGVLLMAAFIEEIVLRGYMLNNFMQSMNPILALLFTSVLFSLSHAFNPNVGWLGLFNIILAGLVLGIYYVHRKNLWFPTGLHLAWNFFLGTVFGSPVSGIRMDSVLTLDITGNELITGGDFGFEASLVSTAVIIVATVMIHFVYRQRQGTVSIHDSQ